MIEKTRAVVLHCLKYNDESLIVHLFTERFGRMAFSVRIPRSRKNVFYRLLYQPLSLVTVDFDYRVKANLQKLKGAEMTYTYQSVPYHPFKSAIALFLAEFLSKALREEPQNPSLFAFIDTSLRWLDGMEQGFSNFHLAFLTRLTLFLGFYPNIEDYQEGCYFDLRNARFEMFRPLHAEVLPPDEARVIPLMLRMRLDSMRYFLFTRAQRNRYLDVLLYFYRLHLPDFSELKSTEVLHQMFD